MSKNKCEVTELICEHLNADMRMYEEMADIPFAENDELEEGKYPKCYWLLRALTLHIGIEALEEINESRAAEYKSSEVFQRSLRNSKREMEISKKRHNTKKGV